MHSQQNDQGRATGGEVWRVGVEWEGGCIVSMISEELLVGRCGGWV